MSIEAAARQAISAMRLKQRVTMWENDGDRAQFNAAIAALDAALSQQAAPAEPVAWMHVSMNACYAGANDNVPGYDIPLYTAPPAPEAPKPLDDPRLQELFSSAISGALAFGAQGNNPPPKGHWLELFWQMGRGERARSDAAKLDLLNPLRVLADAAEARGIRVDAARASIARAEMFSLNQGAAPEAPTDPMDTPLPCDVKVGGGTHRKGTSLRCLVARMQMLHRAAFGDPPSPEEAARNLAVLQGAAPSAPAPLPEAQALREALAELVACKDLKEAVYGGVICKTGEDTKRWYAMEAEYKHRKPLAWEAARAALASSPPAVAEAP
jgi:hypothetical protein